MWSCQQYGVVILSEEKDLLFALTGMKRVPHPFALFCERVGLHEPHTPQLVILNEEKDLLFAGKLQVPRLRSE